MKTLLALFACIGWGGFAYAEIPTGGLFLEPALTYETGTVVVRYPTPYSTDSNETVKGSGLALRIGGHFADIFFYGADIRYAKPNYDSSALGGSAEAEALNLGATVGLQTPIFGLRAWGTYILDGSLDPKAISNVDMKYSGLNGYRIGGGLYIAVISLNLEYQEGKYSNTSGGFGPFAGGTFDDVTSTHKSYILSVSFPIAL